MALYSNLKRTCSVKTTNTSIFQTLSREDLKTIEELKAKIATLETDVKETKSNQSKKEAELKAQKKLIDELQKKLDTIK